MKVSLLIFFAFLFFQLTSFGQTKHATLFIGTDTKLDFSSINSKWKNETDEDEIGHYTNFELSPKIGVYPVNGLVIGLYIPISIYSENFDGDYYSSNSFGIGPFIRYYFNTEKVKPFLNGGIGFGNMTMKESPAEVTTGSTINYELGGGIGIFINKTVSIDIGAGYKSEKFKPTKNNSTNFRILSSGFNAGIGFSIHLGSK